MHNWINFVLQMKMLMWGIAFLPCIPHVIWQCLSFVSVIQRRDINYTFRWCWTAIYIKHRAGRIPTGCQVWSGTWVIDILLSTILPSWSSYVCKPFWTLIVLPLLQFFLGDYRPLIQDPSGNVVDQVGKLFTLCCYETHTKGISTVLW